MPDRLIYIFHGRFPDPRAAALFAATEVASFAAMRPVTLVVPKRDTTDIERGREQFNLPESVELIALPVIDLSRVPILKHTAFLVSLVTFSLSVKRYLRRKRHTGWVITADHLTALAAKEAGAKVLLQIHDFPGKHRVWRKALMAADVVLATNAWKQKELIRRFGIPAQKIMVERNGVDLVSFSSMDQMVARARLGLPGGLLVVYTGHLYAWKGAETLAKAMEALPQVQAYFVGGSSEDVERFKKDFAGLENVHFVGYRPHEEIPLWQAAADALILPNTGREAISTHFTSPMKLFEYMASGRPIIASRIPSITEIVTDGMAYLVSPDNPSELAQGIQEALAHTQHSAEKAEAARLQVLQHSWEERAKRILSRL